MKSWLKNSYNVSLSVLIIIHLVGIVGLLTPYKPYFSALTPFTLILSFLLLLVNHKKHFFPWAIGLLLVGVAGYGVEVLGIQTGFPFGNYVYGKNLGVKIYDTPLLIGLNWAMLIYCTSRIFNVFKPIYLQAGIGAALMLLYDFALEPAAIELGLWQWQGNSIPMSNYISWFIISFIMHWAILKFLPKSPNKIAMPLYLIQFIFFVIINLS